MQHGRPSGVAAVSVQVITRVEFRNGNYVDLVDVDFEKIQKLVDAALRGGGTIGFNSKMAFLASDFVRMYVLEAP